jgi:hypothetical protein
MATATARRRSLQRMLAINFILSTSPLAKNPSFQFPREWQPPCAPNRL